MRTGFKVRGRKLVADGERPGIWTTRENADQLHPQRFLNVPPPDGLTYRPGPPQMHADGARVELSYVMASDTSYAFTDSDTQQRFPVLKRFPLPQLFLDARMDTLFVGNIPGNAMEWMGIELTWDGQDLVWS